MNFSKAFGKLITPFLAVVLLCLSMARLECADVAVEYADLESHRHQMSFTTCPEGALVLVREFEPSGTFRVGPFQIATNELSAAHYVRLVALSDSDGEEWNLPPLDELLNRLAACQYPSQYPESVEKRDKFYKLARSQYFDNAKLNDPKAVDSRLPVMCLSFEEAKRVCHVLERAIARGTSSRISFISTQVSIPTSEQWQYACRGISEPALATSSLNFAAWPKNANEIFVGKQSTRHDFWKDVNDFVDRLKNPDLKPSDDQIDMKLDTSAEIIANLRLYDSRIELFNRMKETKGGGINAIAAGQPKLVCLLRELLILAVENESQRSRVPIAFGLPAVEELMKDRPLAREKLLSLLRDVDDRAASFPNRWGLNHVEGNVREWATASSVPNTTPVVMGCGLFDSVFDWKRALIWHQDKVQTTGELAVEAQVQINEIAGLRPVLSQQLSNEYPSLLARAMRESLDNPAQRVDLYRDVQQALISAKEFVSNETYQADVSPVLTLGLNYLEFGDTADLRLNRSASAAAISHSSVALPQNVLKEEYQRLWSTLSFLEKARPDPER